MKYDTELNIPQMDNVRFKLAQNSQMIVFWENSTKIYQPIIIRKCSNKPESLDDIRSSK